jgi:hypothetical protein
MKKILILIPFLFILFCSCDTLNQVAQTPYSKQATQQHLILITALKQALELATGKSSDQLSAVNGFFGNAAVKILFPPEAQKAEKTLRSIGLVNWPIM